MGEPIPPALSPEQRARDMLERMGVKWAQSMTAGDVVELANLIAHHDELQASDPSWDYTPGAEKYEVTSNEGTAPTFPPFPSDEWFAKARALMWEIAANPPRTEEAVAEKVKQVQALLLPPSDEKPPHG